MLIKTLKGKTNWRYEVEHIYKLIYISSRALCRGNDRLLVARGAVGVAQVMRHSQQKLQLVQKMKLLYTTNVNGRSTLKDEASLGDALTSGFDNPFGSPDFSDADRYCITASGRRLCFFDFGQCEMIAKVIGKLLGKVLRAESPL